MIDNRLPSTGWTPDVSKPATKAQLIALRDKLSEWGHKDGAAAADNLIDLLTSSGEIKETPAKCHRCGGYGKIPVYEVSWSILRFLKWDICPVCHGLGHITDEEAEAQRHEAREQERDIADLRGGL